MSELYLSTAHLLLQMRPPPDLSEPSGAPATLIGSEMDMWPNQIQSSPIIFSSSVCV